MNGFVFVYASPPGVPQIECTSLENVVSVKSSMREIKIPVAICFVSYYFPVYFPFFFDPFVRID